MKNIFKGVTWKTKLVVCLLFFLGLSNGAFSFVDLFHLLLSPARKISLLSLFFGLFSFLFCLLCSFVVLLNESENFQIMIFGKKLKDREQYRIEGDL